MNRRASSRVLLFLAATVGSLIVAELALRVVSPSVRLSYTDARFSPRYHHGSSEFTSLLQRIQHDPAAFKGDLTVVILGDSFVAGDAMDDAHRFTSILQREYDALPPPRIRILTLGFTSYSTLLYERLYRDVVVPLDPDVVIVCLDQTDVADDYLYEQELSSSTDAAGGISNADFTDTVLKNYESYPVTFFFMRHSRLFLGGSTIKQALTGTGFIPESTRAGERDWQKLRLYFETCRDPESHPALFDNSEKYIRSIARMKPAHQILSFVTYPRAEHLAGQHKTTLLRGALPDSHASTPYFEYWVRSKNLAARYPDVSFVHATDAFRTAIASTGRQYYFSLDDVHWNSDGHRLFAEILEKEVIAPARHGRTANGAATP